MIGWLSQVVLVQRWEFIVFFVFIGVLLVVIYVLEWKYFGLKYERENKKKQVKDDS